MIMNANKRGENNLDEHSSKQNRTLFASAQEMKRNLNYKFCSARGGTINMRKSENSQMITISKQSDLVNLTQ